MRAIRESPLQGVRGIHLCEAVGGGISNKTGLTKIGQACLLFRI